MTRSPTDAPTVRGWAAFYDPMRSPNEFAKQGRRLRYRADWEHRAGRAREAEGLYRASVERLVDAFLADRPGQSACFREAHQVGRKLQNEFGCPMTSDDHGDHWGRDCGILALHQRMGSSFGGPTRGCCSICAAPDLGCLHVPGQIYDELRCVRVVYEVDLHEVSLVPFPEDPRCYRLQVLRSRAEIEAAFGGPLPPLGRTDVHPLHRLFRSRRRS